MICTSLPLYLQHETSGQSNIDIRPHHHCRQKVQSYSPGGASVPSHVGPAPNNVLRVLQISSKSVQFRRSYSRTREHHQNMLWSESNISLKPSFMLNKNWQHLTHKRIFNTLLVQYLFWKRVLCKNSSVFDKVILLAVTYIPCLKKRPTCGLL